MKLFFIVFFFFIFHVPFLFSQNEVEIQILQHFARIEDTQSNPSQVEVALQSILAMGKPALPYIQKRFRQTNHPRYWYLIQVLEKKNTFKQESHSGIESYFLQKFKLAQSHLQEGEIELAHKMASAILVLEPKVSFYQEIQDFLKECENKSLQQKFLTGIAKSNMQIYTPTSDVAVYLGLQNYQTIPMTLFAGENSAIILDIQEQEFSVLGDYKERTFTQTIDLKGNIIINPGENWRWKVTIGKSKSSTRSYRKWEVIAKIPRCRIQIGHQTIYPKIQFPILVFHEIPNNVQHIAQNTSATIQNALATGQYEVVFFGAFLLKPSEASNLIPRLISIWPESAPSNNLIAITLRNLTGKKFTTQIEWKNWWLSQNFSENDVCQPFGEK